VQARLRGDEQEPAGAVRASHVEVEVAGIDAKQGGVPIFEPLVLVPEALDAPVLVEDACQKEHVAVRSIDNPAFITVLATSPVEQGRGEGERVVEGHVALFTSEWAFLRGPAFPLCWYHLTSSRSGVNPEKGTSLIDDLPPLSRVFPGERDVQNDADATAEAVPDELFWKLQTHEFGLDVWAFCVQKAEDAGVGEAPLGERAVGEHGLEGVGVVGDPRLERLFADVGGVQCMKIQCRLHESISEGEAAVSPAFRFPAKKATR
jgi:hypothetical protein